MAMTVAEARTLVRELLDDADGDRWTNAHIDTALKGSLARCLSDYAKAGGDRFVKEVSGTTSSGLLDLSSYNPYRVIGVALSESGVRYPLRSVPSHQVVEIETEAKDLVVQLVPRVTYSSTDAHYLVGGASAENTTDEIDQWICARAALQLGVKDDDTLQACRALERDMRDVALGFSQPAVEIAWPRGEQWPLRWDWIESSGSLRLSKSPGASW